MAENKHVRIQVWPGYLSMETKEFNDWIYQVGRKYRKALRRWFACGAIFGIVGAALITAVFMADIYLSMGHVRSGSSKEASSSSTKIITPVVPGVNLPLVQLPYLIPAILVSMLVHEFGHALSAASEGVKTERVALFWFLIFPGALVELNSDSIASLPAWRSLKVFCAGVWHNALLCAICLLVIGSFSILLAPFYSAAQGVLVLTAPQQSPMFGHLSTGDILLDVNGQHLSATLQWEKLKSGITTWQHPTHLFNKDNTVPWSTGQGFCVPLPKKESSWNFTGQCEEGFLPFSPLLGLEREPPVQLATLNRTTCLIVRDTVNLDKCGWGWALEASGKERNETMEMENRSCSHNHVCLEPRLTNNSYLFKVSFQKNGLAKERGNSFVLFVGTIHQLAWSVDTSPYVPRQPFRWMGSWVLFFPKVALQMVKFTFHVSLALSLLNLAPVDVFCSTKNGAFIFTSSFVSLFRKVYYLDGEAVFASLVEICFLGWSRRKLAMLHRTIVNVGSFVFVISLLHGFYIVIFH